MNNHVLDTNAGKQHSLAARRLSNTGVETYEQHLNIDYKFDHSDDVSK